MPETPQFDPRIKELLLRRTGHPLGEEIPEEVAGEEVAVIARLRNPRRPVQHLRPVARFGAVVTARVPLGRLVGLRRDPNVASLKLSRVYEADLASSVSEIRASRTAIRQASGLDGISGRGVVVGFCDWGADFAASEFRSGNASRFLYLWDQRGGRQRSSPEPYGYGREFTRTQIEEALRQPDPYRALGYDPAEVDPGGHGTHGCHVSSIATGNGSAPGTSPGVAPEADIIFCHLKGDDVSPEDTLGDSVRILEAVRYIVDRAGDRPVVVNLSLGRTGGPHDASPLVTQGLDALVAERPGRAVVMSAGNYFIAGLHTDGRLVQGGQVDLRWQVVPRHDEQAEMEVWYPGSDALAAELVDPSGRSLALVERGDDHVVRHGGAVLATCYNRAEEPNAHDNVVNVFLWPGAPSGVWTVRLHGRVVTHGRWHAWIERDDPRSQSRFVNPTPLYTTNSICNGRLTVAVGAYDARQPGTPVLPFSSAGPTRGDLPVPHVSAPGGGIRAGRSSRVVHGRRVMNETVVKSGTSMAAPHVTGIVALMFQAARDRRLSVHETRGILLRTARPSPPFSLLDQVRYGAGRVDAAAAVRAVAELVSSERRPRVTETGVALVESDLGPEDVSPAPSAATGEPATAYPAAVPMATPGTESDGEEDEDEEHRGPPYEGRGPESGLDEEDVPDEGGTPDGRERERLATVLPELLVTLADEELARTDEDGSRLVYDKASPLLFAPAGRRYRVGSGRFSYHAANFVFNTAYSVGYDVPVHPTSSPDPRRGTSYPSLGAIFVALAGRDPSLRAYLERFFEVVVPPGGVLPDRLRPGDVLVRAPQADLAVGHAAIVVDPVPRPVQEFLTADRTTGRGVHCIAAGLAIQRRVDRAGYALGDGVLLDDRVVVRFRKEAIDLARVNTRMSSDPSYRAAIEHRHWVTTGLHGSGSATTARPEVGEALPRVETDLGEEYRPQGGRVYTPSSVPSRFRCRPVPLSVTPATELPSVATDPAAATRAALTGVGVGQSELAGFERRRGFLSLRPFATRFGEAMLTELLRRLRYTPPQIVKPPHTHNAAGLRRLGVGHPAELLGARLLLAVPGHFRELARRAPNEHEAFALENLGWLLMASVRDDLAIETGRRWWVPPPPSFVTPFSSTLPSLSPEVQRLILRSLLVDTTLSFGDYQARCSAWITGPAGLAWRLESGVQTSPEGTGHPFYAATVTVPDPVDIDADRRRVQAAWTARVAATDAAHPVHSDASTAALRACDNRGLPAGLMQAASLQGLEMVYQYPELTTVRPFSGLNVLGVLRPVFEALFAALRALGWNDLLYQCAGAACFRGVKLSRDPADPLRHHRAARRLSEHSLGVALDFNTHENAQRTSGSMDPRIVALFEAFRFRWGRCFPQPDPMHFEYCGAGC